MNAPLFNPSRRDVLAGALVVSFSLRAIPSLAQEQENVSKPPLPGSLKKAPMLDAWITHRCGRQCHRLHRQM